MSVKRKDDKGRILKDGEGQREDGRYYYRYTDLNGKRKMAYALTLADLREKEKQIRRDLEDGIDGTKGQMSLNEMFDIYMNTKVKIKDSSRSTYLSLWDGYVRESDLGKMAISSIKNTHILTFYGKLSKEGLSAATQKNINSLMGAVFKLAVKADYVRKNPTMDCAKEISGHKKEVRALTRKEQAILLEYVKNSNVYQIHEPMLTVFLNTGLREGELCGLRWKDVDFKEGIIHVRQQLVYKDYKDGDGYRYHLQSPKTSSSVRDIPITQECKKALMKQREYDMVLNVKRQTVEGINDFVFINRKGKPYINWGINSILLNIVNKYNAGEQKQAEKENREPVLLPRFSCHVLRHCYAARMAESGIQPRTLMSLMGHSNISVTMNIYANIDLESIKNEVKEAEKFMNVV